MDWVQLSFLAFSAGVSLFGVLAERKRRERRLREWQSAADELGLSLAGHGRELTLSGQLAGVPVRAELRRRNGGKKRELTVRLYAGGGFVPPSLTLRKDTSLRALGRFAFGRDEQIGDYDFDQLVELTAIDPYVCAALSKEVRSHLEDLIARGGVVHQGTLTYEQQATGVVNRAWLVQMLGFLSKQAELLVVTPASLHQRLANNALRDSSPGVRLRNLRFLVEPATLTPAALLTETARALLVDRDERVRLLAAKQVGHEGARVLIELASDPDGEAAVRLEALRALDEAGDPGLAPLLSKLLAGGSPELACPALSIVGARRLGTLLDAVVDCMASEHESLRIAAATALGQLPTQRSEQALIQRLSDDSSDVQRASAEALGRIGSIKAVEPLLPLTEGFGRGELRQAARAAIGRIQSRLGDVEAGRLSLAEPGDLAGALSVAAQPESRSGELSLAEDDASHAGSGSPRSERRQHSSRDE